jgi:DNA-binding MarR family transcriptional regulator
MSAEKLTRQLETARGTELLRRLSKNQYVIDDHRRADAIVAEIATQEARPKPEAKHSTWGSYAKAYRARQPRRGRRREAWIYGHPNWRPALDRNKAARLLHAARIYNRHHRQKGQHCGPLAESGVDILAALLRLQNWKTGACFPSLKRIAEEADRTRSTVQLAVQRLERAGFIEIVPRRQRQGLCRDGKRRPIVISNAYLISGPPETDNRHGNGAESSITPSTSSTNAASAWSADLRSPAATASSRIYLPPGVEPPF